MDLLSGYTSESDADEDWPAAKQTAQTGKGTTKSVVLPNPFQEPSKPAALPKSSMSKPAEANDQGKGPNKRPFTSVAGHSLPTAVSKSKVNKPAAAVQASFQPKAAATMVPPQLKGRSNVVTEDIRKLFTATTRTSGPKSANQHQKP